MHIHLDAALLPLEAISGWCGGTGLADADPAVCDRVVGGLAALRANVRPVRADPGRSGFRSICRCCGVSRAACCCPTIAVGSSPMACSARLPQSLGAAIVATAPVRLALAALLLIAAAAFAIQAAVRIRYRICGTTASGQGRLDRRALRSAEAGLSQAGLAGWRACREVCSIIRRRRGASCSAQCKIVLFAVRLSVRRARGGGGDPTSGRWRARDGGVRPRHRAEPFRGRHRRGEPGGALACSRPQGSRALFAINAAVLIALAVSLAARLDLGPRLDLGQ